MILHGQSSSKSLFRAVKTFLTESTNVKGFFSKSHNHHHNYYSSYSVKEVKIPVPGGELAGKLWEPKIRNEKIPPVICLHGWLDNAGSFDHLLPLVISDVPTTFLAFDLPGHGKTTYCNQWFYDGFVDGIISIQRVLRHFEWDKVSILGHSMGSIISFLHAGFFPEQVHSYIALDIIRAPRYDYLNTLQSSLNLVFEVEEREKVPRKAYPFDSLLKRFYDGRMETVSMEGCKTLLQRGSIQIGDQDLYQLNYNLRTLIPGQEGRFQPEISEQIAQRITCPICFIRGDATNTYEEVEEIEKFLDILRNHLGKKFQIHTVPGGTHHFHLNNPELTATIVNQFLLS